jgi:hypothetical protein
MNIQTYSRNVHVILASFKKSLNFFDRFSRSIQIENYTKIRPAGAKFSMRTDRQTDERMDRYT